MGSVYAATDTVLERVVALKVLDAAEVGHDAAYRKQVLREAKLAARVEHERIARVYDVGSFEGLGFVAMEYVQGDTLRHWMTGRKVPMPQVVDIALQIADGLAAMHANGVVHRDLKPENVMLTAHGAVKLLDFGLARSAVAPGEPRTPGGLTGADGASMAGAAGTPGYMAPEQCTGQPIDARADIFALGVIIYELVTGERLFRGDTVGAIMQATATWVPDLRHPAWRSAPQRLLTHTTKMLARDPEERFADGASARAALHDLSSATSLRTVRLPEVVARSISKPWTPVKLPRNPFGLELGRRGLARKGIEIACGLAAILLLAVIAPTKQAAPIAQTTPTVPTIVTTETTPTQSPPPRKQPPGMVRIDVGTIDVGRSSDEIDRECRDIGSGCDRKLLQRETPRAQVTVRPFYLDKYEVTNDELAHMLNLFSGNVSVSEDEDDHYPRYVRRNLGGGGSNDPLVDLYKPASDIEYDSRPSLEYRVRAGREHMPASLVSWYAAKLFCETLGKRLPTEDEWEAAARGREDRRYPWGDAAPRCADVVIPNDGKIAIAGSCPTRDAVAPAAVGAAAQDVTPDGIHDLGGNVSEWTSSLFVEANRGPYRNGAPRDAPRVIRGGSWALSLRARSTGRAPLSPSIMGQNVGFRCALDAEDTRR
jgi:serine/threonine protein kinase